MSIGKAIFLLCLVVVSVAHAAHYRLDDVQGFFVSLCSLNCRLVQAASSSSQGCRCFGEESVHSVPPYYMVWPKKTFEMPGSRASMHGSYLFHAALVHWTMWYVLAFQRSNSSLPPWDNFEPHITPLKSSVAMLYVAWLLYVLARSSARPDVHVAQYHYGVIWWTLLEMLVHKNQTCHLSSTSSLQAD